MTTARTPKARGGRRRPPSGVRSHSPQREAIPLPISPSSESPYQRPRQLFVTTTPSHGEAEGERDNRRRAETAAISPTVVTCLTEGGFYSGDLTTVVPPVSVKGNPPSDVTVAHRVEQLLQVAPVCIIGKAPWCPYTIDILELLSETLGIQTHVIYLNQIVIQDRQQQPAASVTHTHSMTLAPSTTRGRSAFIQHLLRKAGNAGTRSLSKGNNHGELIRQYLRDRSTGGDMNAPEILPAVFLCGQFLGGCEEVMALHHSGQLERDCREATSTSPIREVQRVEPLVNQGKPSLVVRPRVVLTPGREGMSPMATLLPRPRSQAILPFFLHPHTVNKHVSRVTALLIFALCVVGAAFYYRFWVRFIAGALAVDYMLRFMVGPSGSASAMFATFVFTCFFQKPKFRPGVPEQVNSALGFFFTLMATIFFLVDFPRSDIVACVWLSFAAAQTAMEGFFGVSVGAYTIELGIRSGLVPAYIYRIYNRTRMETIETNVYRFETSDSTRPVKINTDRTNPISLQYKRKNEDWEKDDFDPIRHLHLQYFFCPLSLSTLALAFKLAAGTTDLQFHARDAALNDTWFQVISTLSAFIFVFISFLFLAKAILHRNKVFKEGQDPTKSTGVSAIATSFMVFGFLCYDQLSDPNSNKDSPAQVLGRVFFWIGSVSQAWLTIKHVGQWIGRPMDLERIQPHWLMHSIGLGVAAFTAPVVGPFSLVDPNATATAVIARFYGSFSWTLWITLFVVSFFKVLTQPSNDNRLKHGIWLWLAAPCTLAIGDITFCLGSVNVQSENELDDCAR